MKKFHSTINPKRLVGAGSDSRLMLEEKKQTFSVQINTKSDVKSVIGKLIEKYAKFVTG